MSKFKKPSICVLPLPMLILSSSLALSDTIKFGGEDPNVYFQQRDGGPTETIIDHRHNNRLPLYQPPRYTQNPWAHPERSFADKLRSRQQHRITPQDMLGYGR